MLLGRRHDHRHRRTRSRHQVQRRFHHSNTASHQHESRLRHNNTHDHQPRHRAGASPPPGSLPAYRHRTPATRGRCAEGACLLLWSSTATALCTLSRGWGQHTPSRAPPVRRRQIRSLWPPKTLPANAAPPRQGKHREKCPLPSARLLFEQEVLHGDLQGLNYDLGDMHTPTLKIK
jgi:hypothetical protein